jgi:hypothetical protein
MIVLMIDPGDRIGNIDFIARNCSGISGTGESILEFRLCVHSTCSEYLKFCALNHDFSACMRSEFICITLTTYAEHSNAILQIF